MSIGRIAIVCAFAGALTAGAVGSAGAAPLPTNVEAMKAVSAGNLVQVQWRGGWRGGGWGWRGGGWGWGGAGAGLVAGALIGGAIASSTWGGPYGGYYGGGPYGYYGGGSYYGYPAYGYAPQPYYYPRYVSYGYGPYYGGYRYYGRPFRPVWGYRYGYRRWGW